MKRRIQFSLICCLAAALLLGHRAAAESPYVVDIWNTDDGLQQSSVIALTQTHDGYLWLGTLNGLLRFDGNSFTPFNVNNTPGLTGNGIIFLFEDSHTNLWVGTDNAGLCRLANGSVQDIDTGGAGGNITCAFEDAAGAVWFSTAAGNYYCWRNGRLQTHPGDVTDPLTVEFFNRSKHTLVPGRDGIAWKLEGGRIARLRGDRVENAAPVPWRYSPAQLQYRTSSGYLALAVIDANVTATAEDQAGNLAVGTHGDGIFWMDGAGGWRHITTGENSSQDYVLSLCFDREGNLWAGTDGGGLYRVKKNYFETLIGLPQGVPKSAAEDATGGLWVTFNARGLAYALTNTVSSFPIGQGSNAWAVLVDRQQRVWAGTRGEGLFRFEGGSFQPVRDAGKTGLQIFALLQGRDGMVWAGGENGLAGFDGQQWSFFSAAAGLPPKAVRALAEDTAGGLWIGTEGGGLYSLRDGKISPVPAPVKDISALLFDRDGVLWAGTSGHGLARFAQGHWTVCGVADGLASDDIGYLIEDDLGNLWLGSYEGLMRVEKKALADFAAGQARKIPCRTFITHECSAGAQPAAIRTRDGRLWFPTIDGLFFVNPAELRLNTNPPPVIIESVAVDRVQQNASRLNSTWAGGIHLTPENEQLEIHFTALIFSAPKRARQAVQFRYKLEGNDKNWTDVGDTRVAHFPKLPHGDYTFHVIACNEDGVWNEAGASLAITVEPPFWQTRGFIVVTALIVIAVLAGVIYLISTAKLKRQLRVLHQKELIEKERARIARDLHDQLGANLTQVTLLGEMAEADKYLPDEVEQHAQQICDTARETTHALDEIVWAVNPSNDTLEGLANYACKYAQDYFALAGVSYRAELPPELPATPIPPEVRHNVFLAFKEAVNNVVKHAHATEARVKLQLEPDKFILSVTDNGRGLGDISGKSLRNGMKNMRKRLADVRGEFDIAPGANGGTVVQLKAPTGKPN